MVVGVQVSLLASLLNRTVKLPLKMKYIISRNYCFVDNEPVLMYYVNDTPFAFDTLEKEEKEDKWILSEAAIHQDYTLEDVFRWSDYLIAEECHPVLFELELVNPELIPE